MKNDTQLRQDILDALAKEPTINANDIGVAVHNGIIILSGYVPTYAAKQVAEHAVERVSGVKAIAEEITVKSPLSGQQTDVDIAQAVINALKRNPAMKDEVMVKVEDGIVTLNGDVEWKYERDVAKQTIEGLAGVRGIVNLLGVTTRPTIDHVKDEIKKAFERVADLDAAQIEVETHDGEVTLKGNVHSVAELREAEYAAWVGPGVSKVTNQLKVV
jgi:osmotically-inducible protein OsmY